MFAEEYYAKIQEMLEAIFTEESETLEQVADAVYASLKKGGILHTFGSGHSELLCREITGRAGGLVPVNTIADKTRGRAEQLEGYGRIVLSDYLENAFFEPGEVLIVVSNSGRNPLPIEVALQAKENGLITVALTSLKMSQRLASRHSSGKRLFEICDFVLDNKGIPGDAVTELPEYGCAVGPTSTIAGAFLLNTLIIKIARHFVADGARPPVYHSQNLDSVDSINQEIVDQYRSRLHRD